MTHAGHRAYKKVDQRNRPCDLRRMTNKVQPSVENSTLSLA